MSVLLILSACGGDTDGRADGDDDDDVTDTDTPTGPTGAPHTGDTGGTESCFEQPPAVEVGTGDSTFEELDELVPVEVVFGPQGGYHMLAAVRACHMDAIVTVHLTITDELSGVVVSDVSYLAPTYDEGDCCRFRADLYGYLDVSAVPGAAGMGAGEYLNGKVVVYELQVEDDLGNEATSAVRVTADYTP